MSWAGLLFTLVDIRARRRRSADLVVVIEIGGNNRCDRSGRDSKAFERRSARFGFIRNDVVAAEQFDLIGRHG